ncbi:MAG: M2 family metallopeptidase, partial [Blastocatellia bacterium]|nr:M2 family metallopeptidase [Blastocatellia bacterium]
MKRAFPIIGIFRRRAVWLLPLPFAFCLSCSIGQSATKPSVADAEKFITEAEKKYFAATIEDSRASWIQSNFITDDTEVVAAEARDELTKTVKELAEEARKYEKLDLPEDVARKIKLLKLAVSLPAPGDPKEREELTKTVVRMESLYGKGKYCPNGENGKCQALGDLEAIMASNRNPEELKKAWLGWHGTSNQYRKDYVRFVELANKGAREMGFKDLGAMWRANYDMEPDAFAAEMERLWQQLKPLYDSLHTYVRAKLRQKYGAAVVSADGPIPAHLLGNMWSQQWGNIYDIVKPETTATGYDLTKILAARKTDAKQMVKYGETFFTSLGFAPLPDSFWNRSLFLKPQDREVVCHASAWDIDNQQDVRLKMCIKINEEDFTTVHHELGHNF